MVDRFDLGPKLLRLQLVRYASSLHCVKETNWLKNLLTPVTCGGAATKTAEEDDMKTSEKDMSLLHKMQTKME